MNYIIKPNGMVIGPSRTADFSMMDYYPDGGDYLYAVGKGLSIRWYLYGDKPTYTSWRSVKEEDVPENIRMCALLLGD